MILEHDQEVALTRDLPEYQLKAGDVATVIGIVSDAMGNSQSCILEIFNSLGETIAIITVPIAAVKPLQTDELLMPPTFALMR